MCNFINLWVLKNGLACDIINTAVDKPENSKKEATQAFQEMEQSMKQQMFHMDAVTEFADSKNRKDVQK